MCTQFLLQSLKGKDRLEFLGVDYRMILKWMSGKSAVDWVHKTEDRDRDRAANAVLNLLVS